ncbi:MAG: YqeG family HAD IIIA-type phosphatase [Oscillospiraceae bacterium]
MRIFTPTLHCKRATDITAEMLEQMNIKAVLLDVDNTLTSYTSKEPLAGTREWTSDLLQKGYAVYIVSNNFKERVSHISGKYALPFVSFALKPFPIGFGKARRVLGLKNRDCLVVGDQIFTDILGANLGHMQSILVDPIEEENGLTFRIRRKLECFVRGKCPVYKK